MDWDEAADADQWTEAAGAYVKAAFDVERSGVPETTPCSATACWSVGGREIAFHRDGVRTALVFGLIALLFYVGFIVLTVVRGSK